MISTTHLLKDSRIYYKEVMSLKKNGYDVTCIYIGKEDKSGVTEDGINYIEVKEYIKTYNFLNRIFEYKSYIYERHSYETYLKIYNICKEIRCDVYHLHDIYLLQIVKQIKALPFKPKIIYDVHESYPDIVLDYNKNNTSIIKYLFYLYLCFWELIQASKCDYIINVEGSINRRFERFLGKNKTDIIFNYPLTEMLKLNENIIPYEEKKYDLIYCGGITKLRGALDIIRMVNVGKAYKKDLSIVFVGQINDSNLSNEINAYIKENNLSDNIKFSGSVPFLKVWDYYRQSKIGLIPLHNIKKFRRAVPIKLFEYMISGLPIVGSNLPYIKKVVLDGDYRCGEIVNNIENPDEFCESLFKILDNKDLYNKYSNNSIKAIQDVFNWTTMELKLLDIYNSMLTRK